MQLKHGGSIAVASISTEICDALTVEDLETIAGELCGEGFTPEALGLARVYEANEGASLRGLVEGAVQAMREGDEEALGLPKSALFNLVFDGVLPRKKAAPALNPAYGRKAAGGVIADRATVRDAAVRLPPPPLLTASAGNAALHVLRDCGLQGAAGLQGHGAGGLVVLLRALHDARETKRDGRLVSPRDPGTCYRAVEGRRVPE